MQWKKYSEIQSDTYLFLHSSGLNLFLSPRLPLTLIYLLPQSFYSLPHIFWTAYSVHGRYPSSSLELRWTPCQKAPVEIAHKDYWRNLIGGNSGLNGGNTSESELRWKLSRALATELEKEGESELGLRTTQRKNRLNTPSQITRVPFSFLISAIVSLPLDREKGQAHVILQNSPCQK